MGKTTSKKDDTASIVAAKHKVTADYVRKVVKGERFNEAILATYKKVKTAKKQLLKAL